MGTQECLSDYYSKRLPCLYQGFASNHIAKDNYSEPQLPYVGEDFEAQDAPRLLVVGKAPNSWHGRHLGCTPAEESLERSRRFIRERVMPYYANLPSQDPLGPCRTPFWTRTYLLGVRICRREPTLAYERREDWAQQCFRQLAWTNVFKVGGCEGGNPNHAMCEHLLQHFNTLPDEMEIIHPHVVVFSTGTSYDRHLRISLDVGLEGLGGHRMAIVRGLPPFVSLGVRTCHFQRLTNQALDRLCTLILQHVGF